MTTLRKLYTGAMRLINVVAANETPSEGDMRITQQAMNGMLDSLQADLLNIYTINPYRFLLTGGQQEYTLGPGAIDNQLTEADWVLPRPMRVERAVLLQGANVQHASQPEPTDWFLDTFTGTGTLTTHQGEVNAIWSGYSNSWYFSPGDLNEYVLSGDGTVSVPNIYNPGAVAPSGNNFISAPYYLEMDFSYTSPGAGPYFGFNFTPGTKTGYVMNFFLNSSYAEIDFYYIENDDFSYSLPGYVYVDGDQAGVNFTLRLEVYEDDIIVFLNGVEQFRFGENKTGAGDFWMGMQDSERFLLSRVQGGPVTGPPPPPPLDPWTVTVSAPSTYYGLPGFPVMDPTNTNPASGTYNVDNITDGANTWVWVGYAPEPYQNVSIDFTVGGDDLTNLAKFGIGRADDGGTTGGYGLYYSNGNIIATDGGDNVETSIPVALTTGDVVSFAHSGFGMGDARVYLNGVQLGGTFYGRARDFFIRPWDASGGG